MVTWPSGKARVCKTLIRQFKSARHLHKTVMKKMSQSFFVVASKTGGFANQFLDTVLQCCPTIFGRFSHPDAHYFCRFLEFGRGGDDFLRKNRIISAAFRRFSISPQPISHWLRGFFAFSDSSQFLAAQPCHGCCRRYQCGINDFDSWGGSYGHRIQIDHGGGLETLHSRYADKLYRWFCPLLYAGGHA